MTGRQLLEERIAAARRLADLQEAEVSGLIRASYSPEPLVYSKADSEKQARCELGFREGRELLKLDEPMHIMEEETHG